METFTDDTVVSLASFLSPHDMLSLALSCTKFGAKHGTATKRQSAARQDSSTREVRQRTESISLMEVAACTVLNTKWTDEEKNALPRREDESWIGLYQEFLVVFRLPLQFDKLVGECIHRIDEITVCVTPREVEGVAICSNIMRAGKHHVSFQVTDDDPDSTNGISLGIMRPTTKEISLESCCPVVDDLSEFSMKDYETLHHENVDCCLLNTYSGCCLIHERWKQWEESELLAMDEEQRVRAEMRNEISAFNWEGMEQNDEPSFKIGFELDLDVGTLDVYKNDRRLGTLRSGLVGEYCWAVSLTGGPILSVSIGR